MTVSGVSLPPSLTYARMWTEVAVPLAEPLPSHRLWRGSPPPDAAWPRLATQKHPRAVGTYGPEVVTWEADHRGIHPRRRYDTPLRWWQDFTISRALEHDDDGHLIWRTVIVSGPRQVGKSWLERTVLAWRTHQGRTFGTNQDCLHVAHKLQAAQEVWRPAANWAKYTYGKQNVRWTNGEQMIELPDGSRWLIQAGNDGAGVAFALSMAMVDEAWSIPKTVVDGAISPTLIEAEEPQLWLVSTAGTSASDLMREYRAQALALEVPRDEDSLLILEWSAPPDPDLDIDDPAVWRMASPYWSDRRQAVIKSERGKVSEHEFRQQWLNQWVPTLTEPMFDVVTWQGAEWRGVLPAGALAFGIDVAADRSHAAIVAFSAGVVEVVDARTGVMWLPDRIIDLTEKWSPVAIGLDGSGPAATVADQLSGSDVSQRLVVLRARELAIASGVTYDAIREGKLLAIANADLTAAVLGARRRAYGQSWCFARQVGDTSAVTLLATVAAAWAYDHRPSVIERSRIF